MERNKLKTLLQAWPSGAIVTQAWLNTQGIYYQLSYKLVKSGWLESVGHGAYKKVGEQVSWDGGVYALQQNNYFPLHVGGLTSLELLGQSHFVPLGKTRLQFFNTKASYPKRLLPKWFTNYFEEIDVNFFRYRLFTKDSGLELYDCHNFEILISSTERAILEILSLVPNNMSLEHAFLLIEGKFTLRSELLQELLENCTSQQANRLFLHFAKRCDLPCYPKLNLKTIDLGTGKRKIAEGGEYDPEFKLDLPPIKADDRNIEVKF